MKNPTVASRESLPLSGLLLNGLLLSELLLRSMSGKGSARSAG
jgi:hypothetical protein